MSAKLRLFYRIAKGFALFFLICCIPLVSAEGRLSDNTSVSAGNSAQSIIVPSSSQTPVTNTLVKKTSEDPLLALQIYRQNLTYPRNKIPENLLQIIDPSYPKFGMTPDQTKELMVLSNQLIPAEEAIKILNITNKTCQLIGDQIHLIIHLKPTASLQSIDPIATSVTTRNEEFHVVVAWFDINNLESLASMEEVKSIELVVPPEHSEGNISTFPNETRPLFPQNGSLSPVSSTTITPTAPVSIYVSCGSLLITIVFGIFLRRGRNWL